MGKEKDLLQKIKLMLLAGGLGSSLCFCSFQTAEAKELVLSEKETYFGKSKDEWKEKAKEVGKDIVDWSLKAEEYVNQKAVEPVQEKLSTIEFYKHDSLWLITDKPNKDPNEERNYYFIDKNAPSIKWTFYYDADGNYVSRNSENIVKMEIREMYVSLTDPDVVFKIEKWLDYEHNTFSLNYEDFDSTVFYNEDSEVTYGRFVRIEDIIPLDAVKEKYSMQDLKDILEIINQTDYNLTKEQSYSRVRNK